MTVPAFHSIEAARPRTRISVAMLIFLLTLVLAFARHSSAQENSAAAPAPVAATEHPAGSVTPILWLPLIAGPALQAFLQK